MAASDRLVAVDSTNPRLPDVVIDATFPAVLVHGLVDGGATNNTTVIQTALDAVETSGGGTVVLPAGNFGFSGEITVPQYVNLVGAGAGWSPTDTLHMTRLVALNAGAKVTFESSGGTSGHFVVDGDDIATGPILHRKVGAERMFQSIHVRESLGEGIRIDEAQNDVWVNVQSYDHVGASWTLDNGCGGNLIKGCEIGATDDWHLVITETSGTGPYLTVGPTHNTFDHCIFERGRSATLEGCIDIHGGQRNVFRDCVMSGSGFETAVGLVRTNVDAAGGNGTSSVEFDGCWFFGATSGSRLGIVQTAGVVRLSGNTAFQAMVTAWTYTAGSGKVAGEITYVSVTNRWAGTVTSIVDPHTRPIAVTGESTDTYLYRAIQQGDTGTRLDITPAGALAWGGGSGATDTNLYREAANTLRTDDALHVVGAIELDDALNHDGTTAGFFGVTPATRPTAYTQTYATADKTHAARTATTLTDNTAGTANTTLQALADGVTYANDVAAIRNNFADLAAAVNALIADLADTGAITNSVIDDLQALGLLQ